MFLTKFVSAEWLPPSLPGFPQMIKAIGDDGNEYFIPSMDSDVPPWPQYLADGGIVEGDGPTEGGGEDDGAA